MASRRAAGSRAGTSESGDAILDGPLQPTDRRRHDWPPVRHRLASDHAVALPSRRAGDHGCSLVVHAELGRGHEAHCIGQLVSERAVADDHARDSARRLDEFENAFFLREPADEEDVRRVVGFARRPRGTDTPAGHDRQSRAPSRPRLPRALVTGERRVVRGGRRSGQPTESALRARRPSPRAGRRTASPSRARETPTEASARGRDPRRARRDAPRGRTRRGTAGARARATGGAGGSRRHHARTPARSGGMPRARRPRPPRLRLAGARPHRGRTSRRRRPRSRIRRRQHDDLHSRCVRANTSGSATASATKT